MEDVMKALVWLGFFAAIFLGWYFYLKARNKERMALIESGKDVSEIYSKQEIKFKIPWLKVGSLVVGVGFGMGLFVTAYTFLTSFREAIFDDLTLYFFIASMLLFGGLGLIFAYFIEKPKR